jgi:hypothetical protein
VFKEYAMTLDDWNLIIQAHLSLIWCQWAMDPKNHSKTIGKMFEQFERKYENTKPLNIGTVLMASYPLFLFPQQADFDMIDFEQIDISMFHVLDGTKKDDKKYFCRRIRNALSHSRVRVNNGSIVFKDERKDGSDQFRAKVEINAYLRFIGGFMKEVKDQYFQRRKSTLNKRL